MSYFSKFLPALALAAALTPVAASAHGDLAPQVPAQQQLLVGQFNHGFSQGRLAETGTGNGQLIVVGAAQYAAVAGSTTPQEN